MNVRDRLMRMVRAGGEELPEANRRLFAAVVLVFSHDYSLLFVKRRASEYDPWSGQVAFPGGRWAEGDSSLLDTAGRELYEETGLRLGLDVELLGFLDFVRPANIPKILVRPYVGLLSRELEELEIRPGHEVEAVFWIPLRKIRRDVVEVYSRSRGVMRVLAYRYGDVVIWGMTARILTTIIDTLEPL